VCTHSGLVVELALSVDRFGGEKGKRRTRRMK
jgi:hypothetical protein